jgi:hypothetical protein
MLTAQTTKRPLGWDDIESWRRITETVISPDGNYVAYKSEPWKGDQIVKLYDCNSPATQKIFSSR